MAIEVLPVTTADIPAAVACIQKAFADDPFFKWMFNTSKVRHPLVMTRYNERR